MCSFAMWRHGRNRSGVSDSPYTSFYTMICAVRFLDTHSKVIPREAQASQALEFELPVPYGTFIRMACGRDCNTLMPTTWHSRFSISDRWKLKIPERSRNRTRCQLCISLENTHDTHSDNSMAAAPTRSSLSLATRLSLPRQSARRPSRTLLPVVATLSCNDSVALG